MYLMGAEGEEAFDLAPNLLNPLLAAGYDIIMVDYQEGATYIEQNAMALVAFLNYLNNVRNAGPSVIVGTSMGGQVSRYALAYMEKNNMKHCNRLWVSADSPHQGANVPIGLQKMMNFLAFNGLNAVNDAMEEQLITINQPASKQLITNHYIDPFNNFTPTPNDAPQLFQNYYNGINALGYPQKTRKIALSNGSRTGVPLAMQAGDIVFNWQVPYQGTTCTVTNFARIYANGSSNIPVFHGSVTDGGLVNLCAFALYLCPQCVSNYTNTTLTFNTGLAYDRMPGGRLKTYQSTAETIDKKTPVLGFQGNVYHEDHCFIPTKSGLDLNGTFTHFSDVSAVIDRDKPNESLAVSPFEKLWAADGSSTIQGSSQNELHVELTQNNITWLINEICAGENLIGSVLTTTYNYARPENRFLDDLTIDNGGNLLVNANQLSDFGAVGPQSCTGPKMPLVGATYILESSDCMETLEIKNGGQMQIGDNSNGNKAQVIIHKGVDVILRSGSKLFIHDNSSLIIEDGAKLIFEAGAEIQLLGDESVLEIQGELEIGNNATFTFTHPNSNSGYLKFNVPFNPCSSNPNWACPVIVAGTNASIDLRGDSKTDKILEITDGDMLIPSNMEFFRLWFGKAEFKTADSRLSLGGKRYNLIDATFEGINDGRGVFVYGNASSLIVRCDFDKVKVHGELYYGSSRLNVFQSKFTNGAFVETYGKGIFFNQVDFDNTANLQYNSFAGWYSHFTDYPSIYTKGKIDVNILTGGGNNNYTHNGGITESISFTSLLLNGVDITRGTVFEDMGELKMKCSSIIGNPNGLVGNGVYFSGNAQLRMSNIDGLGFNTISQNRTNIEGNNIELLDFEWGFNNFTKGRIHVNYDFSSNNIPTLLGGNTNTYFVGNPNLDPNITPDNTFNPPWSTLPKAVVYYGNPTPFPPATNIIPIQWQLAPPNPPTSPCNGGTGSGSATTAASPLKNCANCPLVNSTNFNGVPLNEAIEIATLKMELTDSTQNDFDAIGLFYEIFTNTSIDYTDYAQAFLAKYAYTNMKNAVQNCFVTGRIDEADNSSSLHLCVQQFKDVNTLRKTTVNAQNFNEQFYLELDEALLYRLVGRRTDALQKLTTIENCYLTEEHRKRLKILKQVTKIEEDVLTGVIPKEEAYKLLDQIEPLSIVKTEVIADPSANIDSSVVIGNNTVIGKNVTIQKDVVIGENVVIENDVTIEKNVIIGDKVIIKKGSKIEKDATIMFDTEIGKNVVIKKNSYLANNIVVGNGVTIKEKVHINSYSEVKKEVTIKKNATLGSGVFIGKNAVINEKSEIGELSILRKNTVLKDKVKVGNKNIIARNSVLKTKAKTGKNVKVKKNITISSNKKVCDNDTVDNNYTYLNNCSVTLPDLLENTNSYEFAMGYAKTRTNFLNGFTINNSDRIIVGEEVKFIPNTLTSTYLWEFGDCNTSTKESPKYIFGKPGIYLITLIQGNACSSDTLYSAISVFPKPFSDITPVVPFCTSDSDVVVIRNTTVDAGAPNCLTLPNTTSPSFIPLNVENCQLNFVWSFENDTNNYQEIVLMSDSNILSNSFNQTFNNNGTFSTSLATNFEVREETNYEWELTTNTEADTIIPITTSIMPVISFEGCAAGNVQFYSNVSGGQAPYSYSWVFGNGAVSSLSSPLISVLDTGNLTIELTITDNNGCTKVLNSYINVLDCNSNARTGGGDSENEKGDDNQNDLISINDVIAYPNPTNGQITFDYNLEEQARIIITDVLGKTIFTQQVNGNNKLTVDLSSYNKGIFLYRIVANKKVIKSNKIILIE